MLSRKQLPACQDSFSREVHETTWNCHHCPVCRCFGQSGDWIVRRYAALPESGPVHTRYWCASMNAQLILYTSPCRAGHSSVLRDPPSYGSAGTGRRHRFKRCAGSLSCCVSCSLLDKEAALYAVVLDPDSLRSSHLAEAAARGVQAKKQGKRNTGTQETGCPGLAKIHFPCIVEVSAPRPGLHRRDRFHRGEGMRNPSTFMLRMCAELGTARRSSNPEVLSIRVAHTSEEHVNCMLKRMRRNHGLPE